MRIIGLAVALVLLTSNATADPVAEVRCQEIGFSKAAERRDLDAFVTFIDEDARFVGGTGIMRGQLEITAAWSVFFEDDGPAIKWRPQIVEVIEDGDLALSRGPYRVVARDDDGAETERWGTFNSVWRKQADGTWRVVFDAGSPGDDDPGDETREVLEAGDDC